LIKMKKKLFLTVVLLFSLIFCVYSAFALGSVNILEGSIETSGAPGAVNNTEIMSVRNTGAAELSIALNSTDLVDVSDATNVISKSLVSFSTGTPVLVGAGETRAVTLAVLIPAGQKAGTYRSTLNAAYDGSNRDSATLELEVTPVYSYSAPAASVSIIQGTAGEVNITISNTGNANIMGMSYRISDPFVSGTNTLDMTSSATGTVNVLHRNNSVLTLRFNPPASQAVGIYAGEVNLSYSGVNQTVPVTVNIQAINRQLTGSATGTRLVINRAAGSVHDLDTGELTLRNTGNYALTDVTLTSSALTGPTTIPAASVSFSQNHFGMSIGQEKTVLVNIAGLSSSLASGTYTGTLTVNYGGSSAATVPFSLVVSDAVASISISSTEFPASARGINLTKDVTITNNGDFSLAGITLTTNAPNTRITGTVQSTLAPLSSFTVRLETTVPETADSGVDTIGQLTFTSSALVRSVDIKTNAESMLEFDSVKVSIDDGSWDSVTNGGTADDEASPGNKFGVKVKLENLFEDNDEVDIEDIEVTAVFYGAGESGDDIEGNTETFDVDSGDKSADQEIDFDDYAIDWDSDSGKLRVELRADGRDDNGATHYAFFNFTIEVKRENNGEFIFSRLSAPATVRCGASMQLYADGRSTGEDGDDEVQLRIESTQLEINVRDEFQMGAYNDEDCDALGDDEDDCNEFNYRSNVDIPEDIAPGTYQIVGRLYRDGGDKQTDQETIDVRVECGESSGSTSSSSRSGGSSSSSERVSESESSSTESRQSTSTSSGSGRATESGTARTTTSTVDVLYGAGQAANQPARGAVAFTPTRITDTTANESFRESSAYVALLSTLMIVVIIGIIVALVVGLTKPKVRG
jgi:uncharacterized membrane protein